MAQLVLIVGGARSGKSRFAQQLAERLGRNVLFVATAEAGDSEMAQRIALHRAERPSHWETLEQPLKLGAALAELPERCEIVLIDCLTLLISNVLLACGDNTDILNAQPKAEAEIEALLAAIERRTGVVIVVSGEVGMGLVPDNPLGRLYRDLLGRANQALAARADKVYLMVAGLAVEICSQARSVEQAATSCAAKLEATIGRIN